MWDDYAIGSTWIDFYQNAASNFARVTMRPILVFTQALPVFALAPILTVWLGFGMGSKIAMAVLIIRLFWMRFSARVQTGH